jgi:aryl-alcohol dehydrogenase-like predicted oxidoreductase
MPFALLITRSCATLLKRMHELGGSVIDTAAMYGDSEAVIGKALAELGIRKQMFIATKFNAEGARCRDRHQGPHPREARRRWTTWAARRASSVH